MAKNFIVAIELGSTKIRGIAGQKKPDGSISIMTVVEEDATQCIRKGVVYNIDKTVQCLSNVMLRLRSQLKAGIKHVFVGVGGQSIHSELNTVIREQPNGDAVTQALVMEMMDENRMREYADKEILDVVEQEFRADSLLQTDPIGIPCNRVEANLLNILQASRHYQKLNNCFDLAGINIAEMYLSPIALADAVLTQAEKRAGCVLIDLGADTTTVMVYSKNIIRNIAVIPLGSNNITKDLCSLQIEEPEAEELKKTYGAAFTHVEDMQPDTQYPINSTLSVSGVKVMDIVEGRMEEIMANAWAQVPAEYTDKIGAGIILTGGGSNLKNIDLAFRRFTKVDKVRVAEMVNDPVNSNLEQVFEAKGAYNTLIGLLMKGDQNCCGQEETVVNNDIFAAAEAQPQPQQPAPQPVPVRDANTLPQGVVLTQSEKKAYEEEQRRQQQAEEERRRAVEEEEERLVQEEYERRKKARKENSFSTKIVKWLSSLTSEE